MPVHLIVQGGILDIQEGQICVRSCMVALPTVACREGVHSGLDPWDERSYVQRRTNFPLESGEPLFTVTVAPLMPMLRRLLFFSLLVGCGSLWTGGTWAQSTTGLTVDEAVRRGLEQNAVLRATRADASAARARYQQARAARWPSVSSRASYTRLSDNIPDISISTDPLPGLDTTFTFAPVELNRYHAEVAVEQPLFTGFRVRNRMEAARHQADAAAYEVAQEETDVAFQVRQAYWRLYQALAGRDATEEALDQIEAHLRDVQNRREAGAALASDVLAVQTRRSEVRLEQLDAENAVRLARLELNRLIGLPLDAEVQPVADVSVEPLPADVDTLVARALDARPGLDALEAEVEALAAQVDAARGSVWPEVALTGRYVYARPNQYFFTEQDAFRGTWEAGVLFRWSLWEGGAQRAETRLAQARLEGARAHVTAAREASAVEVMQQFLEAQRALEAVAVVEQNVEEAEETLRMVRQQYAEGAALSSQVLDAEQAARTAQARYAQARADYAIARAALLNALGQVW